MDDTAGIQKNQGPPRPRLTDRLLRLAIHLPWPALQVKILHLIFARERRKRGIR